ncbi:MAG: hypothetical protein EOO11_22815, partial [Chitinophagaceae bacterium]
FAGGFFTPDDADNAASFGVVSARYPFAKKEGWWVVLGDAKRNALFAVKRFTVVNKFEVSRRYSSCALRELSAPI